LVAGLTKKKHLKKAVIEHEKELGAQRADEHLATVEDQKQRHAVRSGQRDVFLETHDIAADAVPQGMTPEPEAANGAKGAEGAKTEKKGRKAGKDKMRQKTNGPRPGDSQNFANPLAAGSYEVLSVE
jgi:hypothetical protein